MIIVDSRALKRAPLGNISKNKELIMIKTLALIVLLIPQLLFAD